MLLIAEGTWQKPQCPDNRRRHEKFDASGRSNKKIGQGIRDLTGLQFATNLSSIRIDGSKVSDLSPIAGLTQLKKIDIDFTDPPSIIHDAKQLSRLVNLTFLALHGVEDLTPLAGLPKLEQLFVSHSNIRDLSPLAGLINLELIQMSGALISDLSPLAGLTKLEHYIFPAEIYRILPLWRD